MNKFAVILFTLLFCSNGLAEAGNYYDEIDNLLATNTSTSKKLRPFLKSLIDDHKVLSYKEARRVLFGKIHLEQNKDGRYFIEDVYCEAIYDNGSKSARNSKIGVDKIPNNNVINCEHTWPKSRFSKKRLGKKSSDYRTKVADLHHLYPTDSKLNGIRGNYEFAEVDFAPAPLPCSQNKLGKLESASGRLSSKKYFEPPASHKGNVARALFYFAVRYEMKISSTEEKFLRKWHEEDPVDAMERYRNDEIQKVQNNRNPFIDRPELVELITDF